MPIYTTHPYSPDSAPDRARLKRAEQLVNRPAHSEWAQRVLSEQRERMIHSKVPKAIAEKLGLTPEQLSDRLGMPDQNQGMLMRRPEEEFDAAMEELGLSPEEARAGFKGTFWQS